MSKWGFVDVTSAKRKIESNPDEAASMVSEMADTVLNQQKEIDTLRGKVMDLQTQCMGLGASEARLRGYIDRVKETDPLGQIRDILNGKS